MSETKEMTICDRLLAMERKSRERHNQRVKNKQSSPITISEKTYYDFLNKCNGTQKSKKYDREKDKNILYRPMR